ncbi:MAG: hypothetical protein JJ964_05885 [Rhizobiales bacterium]|nr:hypothetical protein [Hyphomicrobiales bacterium]
MEINELQWPDGVKIRPRHLRKQSQFKVDYQKARAHLKNQIKLMNGTGVKITSTPEAPPVAVYFNSAGKSYCFACDKYKTKTSNLRAIGLTIESLRAIKRHGSSEMMEQAFRGFEALPAPKKSGWRTIFGYDAGYNPSPFDLKTRFRKLAKRAHPDHGGSEGEWIALNEAHQQARIELAIN